MTATILQFPVAKKAAKRAVMRPRRDLRLVVRDLIWHQAKWEYELDAQGPQASEPVRLNEILNELEYEHGVWVHFKDGCGEPKTDDYSPGDPCQDDPDYDDD